MKFALSFLVVIVFFLTTAMTCDEGCEGCDKFFNLRFIEAFNVNNEKESAFVSDDPIKKEAYMIGIKWIVDAPTLYICDNTMKINIKEYKILCNTAFDAKHPEGSDVTDCFEHLYNYVPDGLNEGYVLMTIPQPGTYSFKIIYTQEDNARFEYDTPLINLY